MASINQKPVTANRPKFRYLVGYDAKPAMFIRNTFGDRFFDLIA